MKSHLFKLFFVLVFLMTANNVSGALLAPHLYKKTLDNGLTVIVKETPGTKVATVQIWVKAGSIYENDQEAGITHLIEHMIFKGTPTRGPGQLAEEIEVLGGRINAFTSFEHTVYHATLSSRYWQKALDVLFDSVQHSLFDAKELEREKKVVLEEICMRNDRPGTKLFQALLETSYLVHPYRFPIIGSVESVSGFSRENILAYMDKHYHPENMMVLVVGDVSATDVIKEVTVMGSELEKGTFIQPPLPVEPKDKGVTFFKLEEDVGQSHMALSFPASPFLDVDTPTLDVLTSILGQGEASRLFHELRDKQQLVYHIHAAAFTPRYPGLVEITAMLDQVNMEKAIESTLVEVFKLKYLPVTDDELARAKRSLEADFTFNLEKAEGQARTLGSFELQTGSPLSKNYLEQVRSITREDIMAVAQKYLTTANVTGGFLVPRQHDVQLDLESFKALILRADEQAQKAVPASYVEDAYLTNVHRYKLENGLTLLVREDNDVDTVAIRAIFLGGLRSETEQTNGAFAYIADLFPKTTEQLGARELSVKVADMAGSLTGFSGRNTFGLQGAFLGRYFDPALELVRDVLMTPGFDEEEAERIRMELLAQLKHQDDSLPSVAFREFNRLLFQGHPYGLNILGAEHSLRQLQVEELKALYKRFATPDACVLVVVGNVKAKDVHERVQTLFGEWERSSRDDGIAEESFLSPDMPAQPEMFNVERDKEQVHIVIGFLGATLKDEDYYGLQILDNILSGQSGRLFLQLRDKQSLAYSLSAFTMAGLDTGSFGVYIGTSPDKRDEVIKALWKQLYLVLEQPVSDKELRRAQNVLISNYELGLQTHGEQAMDMGLNETYGLGQDYGVYYQEKIRKITPEKVLEIARKYIQPDHYIMVTAGARTQDAGTVTTKE